MLIFNGDGVLILENTNGIRKPDAVFLIVRLGFVGIPFVIHQLDYMHNCTQAQERSYHLAAVDLCLTLILAGARKENPITGTLLSYEVNVYFGILCAEFQE